VLRRSIPDQRDGITTDNGPGVGWVENRDTLHWLENRGTVPAMEISVDVVRRDRWSAAEDQGMLPSWVSLSAVLKSVATSFPVPDQAVSAQPAAEPCGPVRRPGCRPPDRRTGVSGPVLPQSRCCPRTVSEQDVGAAATAQGVGSVPTDQHGDLHRPRELTADEPLTVTTAVPVRPSTGRTAAIRLRPLPQSVAALVGTRAGLEEVRLNVTAPAESPTSASATAIVPWRPSGVHDPPAATLSTRAGLGPAWC
jgi:hypothetical protein